MKIGVYGLGNFGAFWAKELVKAGYDVIGTSRTPKQIEGFTFVDYETLCKESHIIFICSSIASFEEVVEKMSKNISEDTIIADTCSVKLHPLQVMQKYLKEGQYVATHPMFGPQSGANGIQGLPIVLDTVGNEKNQKLFEDMFSAMELKVINMSSDEHDKQVAYSQALTHFLGRALGKIDLQESEIATYAYKNLLHLVNYIENNSLELFKNMQSYNPYTSQMREDVLKCIHDANEALK